MKKTDMIKFAAGVFAVSAVLMSFTGCDIKDTNQSSVQESSVSIQDDSVKQDDTKKEANIKTAGEDHTFDNIKSIQLSGDDIYVYEQMSGVVQKEISTLINVSSLESQNVDFSAVSYLYIQYIASDDKNVCMTYCDAENNLKICTIDLKTGKIISDEAIPQDTTIFSLKSDGKGNFTAVKTVYTDTGVSYRYTVFDGNTLKIISETELSGKYIISDTELVTEAFTLPDDSVAFYTADYKSDFTIDEYFYLIKADGEKVFAGITIEDQIGHPAGMYIHENGNLCVCTTDDFMEYHVYEIDSQTGEKKDFHTIEAGNGSKFISTLRLEGYDFTYISPAGVTGCSFDGSKKDVVLKFGKDLDSGLKDSFNASSYGDIVYMYSIANAETSRTVTAMDKDGKVKFSSELPAKLGYASMFGTAPDGSVIYSETYDPGHNMETATGYNMAYIFHVLDNEGNPKSTFTIDEIDSFGDAVIQSIDVSERGEIYMLFQTIIDGTLGTRVYVTDRSGKILNRYILDVPGTYITDVVVSDNGNYAVCIDSENSVCVTELNGNEEIKRCDKLLTDLSTVVKGNGKYDIYFMDDNHIFGHSIADQEDTELIDVSEYLGQRSVTEAYVISDEKFVCATYDSETGETGVVILEK